jgi:hypothetical protein
VREVVIAEARCSDNAPKGRWAVATGGAARRPSGGRSTRNPWRRDSRTSSRPEGAKGVFDRAKAFAARLLRSFGASSRGSRRLPRVALRSTRGYIPAPRWGEIEQRRLFCPVACFGLPRTPGLPDTAATCRRRRHVWKTCRKNVKIATRCLAAQFRTRRHECSAGARANVRDGPSIERRCAPASPGRRQLCPVRQKITEGMMPIRVRNIPDAIPPPTLPAAHCVAPLCSSCGILTPPEAWCEHGEASHHSHPLHAHMATPSSPRKCHATRPSRDLESAAPEVELLHEASPKKRARVLARGSCTGELHVPRTGGTPVPPSGPRCRQDGQVDAVHVAVVIETGRVQHYEGDLMARRAFALMRGTIAPRMLARGPIDDNAKSRTVARSFGGAAVMTESPTNPARRANDDAPGSGGPRRARSHAGRSISLPWTAAPSPTGSPRPSPRISSALVSKRGGGGFAGSDHGWCISPLPNRREFSPNSVTCRRRRGANERGGAIGQSSFHPPRSDEQRPPSWRRRQGRMPKAC